MISFTLPGQFQRRIFMAILVGPMLKSDNDNDHAMLITFLRGMKKKIKNFSFSWLFYLFFKAMSLFSLICLIKWMKRIQRFSGIIGLTSFHEKNTIHCFFTLFFLFLSWIDHIFLMAFNFICNELISRLLVEKEWMIAK